MSVIKEISTNETVVSLSISYKYIYLHKLLYIKSLLYISYSIYSLSFLDCQESSGNEKTLKNNYY